MQKLGEPTLCRCGCNVWFNKKSGQHIYADGQRCKARDTQRLIDIGEIVPSHFHICEVCKEPIPVYKEIPGSATRLTCDNKCGAILRATKGNDDVTRPSLLKPHRQDYCRQDGECEKYSKCLDLGAKGEWPRDRGENCFKKRKRPLSHWDKRSAIQMAPHSTDAKQGGGV